MAEITETEEIPKYKIILIEDEFLGKSSIFTRFVDNKFESKFSRDTQIRFFSWKF